MSVEIEKIDAEAKAKEIGTRLNCKVFPIVFIDDETNEEIIGYIKEPSRTVKLRAMDKAIASPMTASSELFDCVFIPEESDARILTNDNYYLGASLEAFKSVQIAINTFKKK